MITDVTTEAPGIMTGCRDRRHCFLRILSTHNYDYFTTDEKYPPAHCYIISTYFLVCKGHHGTIESCHSASHSVGKRSVVVRTCRHSSALTRYHRDSSFTWHRSEDTCFWKSTRYTCLTFKCLQPRGFKDPKSTARQCQRRLCASELAVPDAQWTEDD